LDTAITNDWDTVNGSLKKQHPIYVTNLLHSSVRIVRRGSRPKKATSLDIVNEGEGLPQNTKIKPKSTKKGDHLNTRVSVPNQLSLDAVESKLRTERNLKIEKGNY